MRVGRKAAPAARIAAAVITIVAAAGLLLQAHIVYVANGTLALTVWILLRYFTITTNGLVVVVFAAFALAGRFLPSQRLVAGTALAILLVGVVNALLLRGLDRLFGVWRLDDFLVHAAVPTLVTLFWLLLAPKGALRWRDPFLWGLYPLVYLIYALARGAFGDLYAYPFINVVRLGWQHVALNAGLITVGFILVGLGCVWVDKSWSRPRSV